MSPTFDPSRLIDGLSERALRLEGKRGSGTPRVLSEARNTLAAGGQIDGSDDRGHRVENPMELNSFRKQFVDAADACALAQAIVDTVREPVLVLDKALRVIAASQ
jgi:hypothetical protein